MLKSVAYQPDVRPAGNQAVAAAAAGLRRRMSEIELESRRHPHRADRGRNGYSAKAASALALVGIE